MMMRLAVLPELRHRLRARAWAGGRVETLVFRSAPEAEVFVVSGRLLPRTDGEEGALGVLWLRLDGLFTPDERFAINDFSRCCVRADQIEALRTSEIAARLPMLDRPLPLGGPESDVIAWAGWGEPEGFGRWTVGGESRLRFRRPGERGEAVDAAAIEIAWVFSAGRPVVFEVQVGSEAPSRFQFPEAADIAPPLPAASSRCSCRRAARMTRWSKSASGFATRLRRMNSASAKIAANSASS